MTKPKPKTKAKLAVSAITAKRLRKIAAHILEEPKRFNMNNWVTRLYEAQQLLSVGCQRPEISQFYADPPACETMACIAGWAVIIFGDKQDENTVHELEASKLLRLRENQSTKLFYVDGWPEKYGKAYRNAKRLGDRNKKAKIAAQRIEHFIKTGE